MSLRLMGDQALCYEYRVLLSDWYEVQRIKRRGTIPAWLGNNMMYETMQEYNGPNILVQK